MASRREFALGTAASLLAMAGVGEAAATDPTSGIYPATLRALGSDGDYAPFPAIVADGPDSSCAFPPTTGHCVVVGVEVQSATLGKFQTFCREHMLNPGDIFAVTLRPTLTRV